jgi:DNA repair protein RecN (Recombination protein N)
MLDRILIKNFATIENVEFDLGKSLNIVTGETGTGKSVLVEAISIALGGRADISMVRSGTDKAVIQIAFTKDGEDHIISRELFASGKSTAKIDGELVSLAQLKSYCSSLADVHGQYDNQRLLDPENHIYITDSFHSELMAPELDKLKNLYDDYRSALAELNSLIREQESAARQNDYLKFENEYINGLSLRPGEDEELSERLDLIKNSEKIFQAVNAAYDMLKESDSSALTLLDRSSSEISSISSFSTEFEEMSSSLQSAYYDLDDLSGRLRSIRDSLDFSADDLDSISERLSVIEDAKRKYKTDIEGILKYQEDIQSKLDLVNDFESNRSVLQAEVDRLYSGLSNQAALVSEMRGINAARLRSSMERELSDLNFANSEFDIRITRSDEIGPLGYDEVEFMISTNPGEDLKPLSKIASGGEISRIMLAFKHIIGDGDKLDTMIFDEIDAGISGRTALVVGKKLKEISGHHQIICITHLPQIAAYGTDNYLIDKDISSGRSITTVSHLDESEKIKSIASLISGDEDSGSAMQAARDLIESAEATL